MRKHDLVACFCLCFFICSFCGDARSEQVSDYAVQVSASVSESPPSITLSWPAPTVQPPQYHIFRKNQTDTSFGSAVATLAGNATNWTDRNVSVGSAYEYAIDTGGSYGHGFIYAGIRAPMKDLHGKLVLLVDNTISGSMPTELGQLQTDLACDGWQVIRHDVGRYDTVTNIKSSIQQDYNSDPSNVKAVMLFGHVPVPYSGDINPDGHSDHKGAWGADCYYGTMSGNWTDSTVNDTGSSARIDNSQANWNRPGDGKFDQSTLPADVILQVGRVDLHDLTEFAPLTETDLLKNYLNKDHKFRMGQISLQRRGIIDDNFGTFNGEAFAANGFRNFAPMFGAGNITVINSADQAANTSNFFGTLSNQTYLCAYGCGPGYFYQCDGVGKTDYFAQQDPKAAFYMAFGSYFGDWDCEMDYLRAPLGAHTAGLACVWAGRPNWYLHPMALGENIGFCTTLTQNNSGLYPTNTGGRMVHIALMGDPTLRLYPVLPPSDLTASPSGLTVNLNWSASTDSNIVGYHVYRCSIPAGFFSRITNTPITGTSYSDSTPANGAYSYLVRAVKLETSSSGTFYNPSQGAMVSVSTGGNSSPVITSSATAVPNPTVVGQTVTFSVAASDPNGDPLTYSWNFGDGSSSSNGTHSYTVAGTYTATVTVSDGQGHSVTSSVLVMVNAASGGGAPVVTNPLQAWPNNPALGQKVLFTISVSDPNGYSIIYNYGDGSSGTVENHVYNTNGKYTVTAAVTDKLGGVATSSTSVVAGTGSGSGGGGSSPVVTTALQAWPNNPTLGQKVLFTISITDPNSYSINYNYGDGSTGNVENHSYTTNGTYTVTATITDSKGGTATSTTKVVAGTGGQQAAGANPIITTALQAWPNVATVGQKVLFTVSASDPGGLNIALTYDYGDGSGIGRVEQHAYSAVGVYTVTITATNTAGLTAASKTVVTVH